MPGPVLRPVQVERIEPLVRAEVFAPEDSRAVTIERDAAPLVGLERIGVPLARVAPQLDLRRSPPTAGFYPATSRRLEEEGAVTVSACIGAQGDTRDLRIAQSSGFARLDEAALRWAQRARFAPGSEGGRAVEVCGYRFRVVFALER